MQNVISNILVFAQDLELSFNLWSIAYCPTAVNNLIDAAGGPQQVFICVFDQESLLEVWKYSLYCRYLLTDLQ